MKCNLRIFQDNASFGKNIFVQNLYLFAQNHKFFYYFMLKCLTNLFFQLYSYPISHKQC